jgi:CRISPR/Cas system endoribonuclease Cas6 (RAMP superfamily)
MENKSVTAVEFLIQKTSDNIIKNRFDDKLSEWQEGYNVALEDVIKLLNQALEMEWQQIIDAHVTGHNASSSTIKQHDAEQYYNETYKK